MSSMDWKPVGNALLGSWPSQVASWGPEAIAAYISELGARGVTPDQALVAIRSCGPEQKFPPSAPELAGLARRDPGQPTGAEMLRLVYGPRGVLRARPVYKQGGWRWNELQVATDRVQLDRAVELSPLLGRFVVAQGLDRLRRLNLDGEHGDLRRRQLVEEWDRFCSAVEEREIASLIVGRRGGLGRLDPLEALGIGNGRAELESGSAT